MSIPMSKIFVVIAALLLAACGGQGPEAQPIAEHGAPAAEQPVKGPNNGRMLKDGPFAIELAIFETGVPPEYHAGRRWTASRFRSMQSS
jgi:membrane fusion protein, heavy metal efflux system